MYSAKCCFESVLGDVLDEVKNQGFHAQNGLIFL
jgi:hypothetical protein